MECLQRRFFVCSFACRLNWVVQQFLYKSLINYHWLRIDESPHLLRRTLLNCQQTPARIRGLLAAAVCCRFSRNLFQFFLLPVCGLTAELSAVHSFGRQTTAFADTAEQSLPSVGVVIASIFFSFIFFLSVFLDEALNPDWRHLVASQSICFFWCHGSWLVTARWRIIPLAEKFYTNVATRMISPSALGKDSQHLRCERFFFERITRWIRIWQQHYVDTASISLGNTRREKRTDSFYEQSLPSSLSGLERFISAKFYLGFVRESPW